MNCLLALLLSRLLAPVLSLLCLSDLLLVPAEVRSEDAVVLHPLKTTALTQLDSLLPSGTHLLIERSAIEAFLTALDGAPPDWAAVYGSGHHDLGHDERLFNLNRERDAAREGNPALNRQVAFVWTGELSQFDPETKGYSVAVGPEFTATSWGMVRFKPEELPSNLRVKPDNTLADLISRRLARHEKVHVIVVMAGALSPSESIIYDFSHDEEGVGMIMPMVRIEHVEVVLRNSHVPRYLRR